MFYMYNLYIKLYIHVHTHITIQAWLAYMHKALTCCA